MTIELNALLKTLSGRTREKFERMPSVVLKDGSFDVEKLPVDKAEWHRLTDVVAVMFDLKSSTNLEKGRKPPSTASIYDAGVGGVVQIFGKFDADFVDIQGDGGFALFWDERHYERAMCAAISIHNFSDDFESQLKTKWPDAPTTGFKVGVASGQILAKRVGLPRHLNMQEPVWAGRPVNYAAKAAQQTEPGLTLVTGSVWDALADNDYLAFSCGCDDGVPGGEPSFLWEERTLDKIPDDEQFGQVLKSGWCENHGEDYCNAILRGETFRAEISEKLRSRQTLLASGSENELAEARKRRAQIRKALEAEVPQRDPRFQPRPGEL
ncbi:adenylate/guanylate cyclase domain-containing protein [Paenarthrobacter sp. TAF1]|uniref:adenylate/guanylate cyclase domain-containing protein n=1 Tax=Paenarthrobacter sp. TAF1 TaxID=3233067 RepID=UPI003F96FA25